MGASDYQDEDAKNEFEPLLERYLSLDTFSKWNGKRYDIVCYGMSGYTGHLAMHFLKQVSLKHYPGEATFAFAGLAAHRIKEVRDRVLGETALFDTPIIQADLENVQDVIDMVSSARVIVNFAGPYMVTHGELLVDTCIHLGVHYVDASAELPWTIRLQDMNERAVRNNVLVLPMAAPVGTWSNLIVHVCSKMFREEYGEEVRKGNFFVTGGGDGNPSNGTLRTRAAMSFANDEVRKTMANPFALGGFVPDFDRCGVKQVDVAKGTGAINVKIRKEDLDAQMQRIKYDPIAGWWCALMPYGVFDSRIIRCANDLCATRLNQPYGRQLNFTMTGMMPGEAEQMPEAMGKGTWTSEIERARMEKIGRFYMTVGSGPTPVDTHTDWFSIQGYCQTASGHIMKMGIVGKGGYVESARISIEAAMVILKHRDKLPIRGGVSPPGAILGDLLLERLIKGGLRVVVGRLFTFEELQAGCSLPYQEYTPWKSPRDSKTVDT
eukprot:NODE_469_length_1543_cov_188.061156.p1 GENE.NODE_469_length_1543_cov_188.061156~~NODE_469_length_1543_cov_188.061156.p1  ORF type:complete len:493 (-),score=91.79 NODE_469_length_1543_cov_188.061156:47-1525(-)